jgi:hypothetical protein
MGIEPTAQAWEATSACLVPISQHVVSASFPSAASTNPQRGDSSGSTANTAISAELQYRYRYLELSG